MTSLSHPNRQTDPKRPRGRGESQFLLPFLTILVFFAVVSLSVNLLQTRTLVHRTSFIDIFLNESWTSHQSSGRKRERLIHLKGYRNFTNDKRLSLTDNDDVEQDGENAGRLQLDPDKSYGQHHLKRDHMSKETKRVEADYKLAGLNCDAFGGPSEEIAKEMVYWEDIPSDTRFISPFKKKGVTKYLTFDADGGGWNNIRMAMETTIALAFAMGRTLVLPPKQVINHMNSTTAGEASQVQQYAFSFLDFFPLDRISKEHLGIDIITMREFLEREGITGNLRDNEGRTVFPPGNLTNLDEVDPYSLSLWLRKSMHSTIWDPDLCMAAFPASSDPNDVQALLDIKAKIEQDGGFPSYEAFVGAPSAINASTTERMKENWAGRKNLCIYNEELQNAHVVHFPHDMDTPGARLLVHFYAFLFFQDWRHDLWMKRFIRDHLRYKDEIQCAAARIVHSIRERSKAKGKLNGEFDTFHVRRGDFGEWFRGTAVEASYIYEVSKQELAENSTVYIATDEKNRSYFDPLREHYHILFLDDFREELGNMNTNMYGMIDQLVASRGQKFFGCWFSTFTGYINRLRGYHANRAKAPGYEHGIIASWYYVVQGRYDFNRRFFPVKQPYHSREFPAGWRLIDAGIQELWEHTNQKEFVKK